MNWKHTLAMIVAFATVSACTDEPGSPMDDPEMVLEVGGLGLTEESAKQLEEAILSAGGLDRPLRMRVLGPDGVVLREIVADSYHDLLTVTAQESAAKVAEIEKEMEGLLAAIASGELAIDLSAWREGVGELQSVFDSVERKRGAWK